MVEWSQWETENMSNKYSSYPYIFFHVPAKHGHTVCICREGGRYLLSSNQVPAYSIVRLIYRCCPTWIYHHGNLTAVHSPNKDAYVDLLSHLYFHPAIVRVREASILIRNHPDLVHALFTWKNLVDDALKKYNYRLISIGHTGLVLTIHARLKVDPLHKGLLVNCTPTSEEDSALCPW